MTMTMYSCILEPLALGRVLRTRGSRHLGLKFISLENIVDCRHELTGNNQGQIPNEHVNENGSDELI
jgi:hypothetical protein